jgi:hypothetical protein
VIHVYAFTDGLRSLPDVAGLDGAPLEQLSVAGITAVFSRRADAPLEARRAQAVAHGAVVDALAREADAVLPARFGEVLGDETALADSVRSRADELRHGFSRVRDCVEVGLRVWGAAEAVDAASGTDYMRRRRALENERRAVVDELHASLAALARDARVDRRPLHGNEQLVAAYLVARGRVDELRAFVEAFASRRPELTVVCTGPWAPFTFVGEEAA